MNAALPTQLSRKPERDGLVFHEIVADGLIHTAVVFGFELDERFVERLATLAWANGAGLVKENVAQAADISRRLAESLESGRDETDRLCRGLAPAVESGTDPLAAIRGHYERERNTRALSPTRADDAGRIRQLIGEAVLGGLLSRGLSPGLYRTISGINQACRNEQAFLAARLWWWADNAGLPIYHPLVELAVTFYPGHPRERDLVCHSLARRLENILRQGQPMELTHWLEPAWRDGLDMARLAPDEIANVVAELPDEERAANLRYYQECIGGTRTPAGRADLPAAYDRYMAKWNHYGFASEETRLANARLVAVRAYDFALWMGVIAQLPGVLAEKRGDA